MSSRTNNVLPLKLLADKENIKHESFTLEQQYTSLVSNQDKLHMAHSPVRHAILKYMQFMAKS